MTSIAIQFLNELPVFSHFNSNLPLRPSLENKAQPRGGVKILDEISEVRIEQGSRRFWNFLTLGVPLLIETMSLFWLDIVHRQQEGVCLHFKFKTNKLPEDQIPEALKFHQFNEISRTPLNKLEADKVHQYINRLINRRELASTKNDRKTMELCEDWLNKFSSILKKNLTPKLSRKDFTMDDWEVLDLVDFELAAEHFASLTPFFNSSEYRSSRFQEEMNDKFQVDYNEATIAEGLSLSLAYIEHLHGKKICLPIKTGHAETPYRSAEYTIVETFLGDALPCYILESTDKEAPPWFVIRGTQSYTEISPNGKEYRIGSLESILADAIDHKEIARDVIKKSLVCRPIVKENGVLRQKKSLTEIFERWRKRKTKVRIAGHSLGASLANYLTVRNEKIVERAYGFSGAGVSTKVAKKWDKKLKKKAQAEGTSVDQLEKKIVNFDYEGDFVPAGGARLIGLHLALTSQEDEVESGLYHAHVRSRLNHNFKVRQVNIKKENSKLSRKFCELLRYVTGLCLRVMLNLCYPQHIPDWWKNRKIYRKKVSIQKMALKKNRAS